MTTMPQDPPPTAEPALPARSALPELRFVRGAPDEDEIAAATVALFLALRQGAAAGPPPPPHRPPAPAWRTEDYRVPGAWASA